MSEYFTATNVAIVLSLLASFYALLKTIAPKTKTTADDKVVELVEKARPWVSQFGGLIWSFVEQMANTGKIEKLNKASEYMKIIRESFKQAFSADMPEALNGDAELIAKGLSAIEKLEKGVTLNPTPARDEVKSTSRPII